MDEPRYIGEPPGPRDYSAELIAAVLRSLPDWVDRTVRSRLGGSPGIDEQTLAAEIATTAAAMVEEVRASLGDLLSRDPEEQRANPLQVLRARAGLVTGCLGRLGARPVPRDEFDRSTLPDDVFGVGPLTWRDLGEEVHEAGITWGAWKAAVVMSRHRGEGEPR